MKFLAVSTALFVAVNAERGLKGKKTPAPTPAPTAPPLSPRLVVHTAYYKHHLVGLLNYPNSAIPDILNGVTSGTKISAGPYNYIPRYGIDCYYRVLLYSSRNKRVL